jgi:hypothetical protein
MVGMGRAHRGVLAFVAVAAVASSVASSAWPALRPVTVAQYRVRAKAICAIATHEQNGAGRYGNLAQRLAFDLHVAQTAYDALARLNPPPQLRQLHAAMLADTRALLAQAPALIQAAREGTAAFARVSAQESASDAKIAKELARIWVRLGVPSCNAS